MGKVTVPDLATTKSLILDALVTKNPTTSMLMRDLKLQHNIGYADFYAAIDALSAGGQIRWCRVTARITRLSDRDAKTINVTSDNPNDSHQKDC